LAVLLPPAEELLGNTVADANYFLDVTTAYPNPNFPWTLYTSVEPYTASTAAEVEPNDTVDLANDVLLGDTLTASIDPACDYDSFNVSLTEARYVVFKTDGGDTTMKLTDSAGDYLGCDDDGNGLASKIEGCLPAGDYYVQVRAYSSTGTIDAYEFNAVDMGSCVSTDPPTTIFDELYRCDNAQEPNEFDTCPNTLGN
jgi:hypothetical protein